jgi:hypothetical protein
LHGCAIAVETERLKQAPFRFLAGESAAKGKSILGAACLPPGPHAQGRRMESLAEKPFDQKIDLAA